MYSKQIIGFGLLFALVATIAAALWFRPEIWNGNTTAPKSTDESAPTAEASSAHAKIIVGEAAQKNLEIVAKPLRAETYWKTTSVPGMIVDRPGVSDREVVAPAAGSIAHIFYVPGDTVKAGDTLFSLRILSDSVQQAESRLYKSTQEIQLAEAQRERLAGAGEAIARSRVIEVENEIKRLRASMDADRFELRNGGLSGADIEGVAAGRFVTEIPVVVPQQQSPTDSIAKAVADSTASTEARNSPPAFEVQKLAVSVGQQVQAGESLCVLSNHQELAIEGKAFRDEAALVERSMKQDWPVQVDFQEESAEEWPPVERTYSIRRVSNTIDPASRTFAFLMQITNQAKAIERDGKTQLIWRFRPGQKVRINVRVERLDNVFVLPADAVTREGPEVFVFTQNVNTFERKSVHVLYQDREHAIVASDGAFQTYAKDGQQLTMSAVVRGAAAQLNRMMKSGPKAVPKGYHIHADGSLHKNEDEGK